MSFHSESNGVYPCFRSKSDENVLSTNENGEQRHLRIGCISGSDEKPNFASLPHNKKNERLMTTSMIGVRGFGNKSEEHLNGSVIDGSHDTLNENRGRHSNFLFGRSLFHRSSRKGAWVKYLTYILEIYILDTSLFSISVFQ